LGCEPKQSKAGVVLFRRWWSPAARSKGRRGLRDLWWFCCVTCRGLGWPEREISTRTRGGGGKVTVDGEVPAVNFGKGLKETEAAAEKKKAGERQGGEVVD
jgi:hypothetical protein